MSNRKTVAYQCDVCESRFDENHPTCPECTIGQLDPLQEVATP